MATHIARLQKARYHVAEDLARAGHSAEAIDICWGLRADPALTRWNRALVNLLLATELDVENYPDAAKFANAAINLSDELLRKGVDDEDKVELIRIRRHAEGALEVINQNLEQVRAERQAAKEARAKGRAHNSIVDCEEMNEGHKTIDPRVAARSGENMDAEESPFPEEKRQMP